MGVDQGDGLSPTDVCVSVDVLVYSEGYSIARCGVL